MKQIIGIMLLALLVIMTGCYRVPEPTVKPGVANPTPGADDGQDYDSETIYKKFLTSNYCTIAEPRTNTESLSSGTAYDLTSVKYSCSGSTEAEFSVVNPKTVTNRAFVEEISETYKPSVESVSAELEKVVKIVTSDIVMVLWYDKDNVYLFRIDRKILDTEPNGMQELLNAYLEKYPSSLDVNEMNNYINSI